MSKRKQRGKEKDKVVFPVAENLSAMPENYQLFISQLKEQIKSERFKSVLSANRDMILMYWNIGNLILEQQKNKGWGSKVIDRMSYDLRQEFPDMSGFSPRNLKYMRKFAEAWPNIELVQRSVALIPWRSNITLLDKLDNPKLRLWYAQKTVEYGYSKDVLAFQIESQLHLRQGNAVTNFENSLPNIDSDLATESFKDPYIFDFVGNSEHMRESELEQSLVNHIKKFLLELGQGFALVGQQVHFELNDTDYYVDLLFYHIKLKRYVVVELKTGTFKPEYIGKLNMYLNVVNDVLCQPDDNTSIGLLLVKEKNKMVVEYALSGFHNPIGVSNWEHEIINSIPDNMKTSLPSIDEIEKEFAESSDALNKLKR